jgi:hypothetical protein
MGLLNFSGAQPTKSEIAVAKNYLDDKELKRLNTLVAAYFDAAEFRAQEHQPTYMKDWLAHLDRLIMAMEAKTLSGAGTISHEQVITKAEQEFNKYRAQLDAAPSDVEKDYLETLKRVQRTVEGRRKK